MEGTVEKVYRKPWEGKTLWSFTLTNDKTYWRCGEQQPQVKPGERVTFETRGDNVVVDTITRVNSTEQDVDIVPPSLSISAWAAARADACRIVATALNVEQKGLEVLPWAKNTAKAKKLDLLVGYIEQVTKQLIEQEQNQ